MQSRSDAHTKLRDVTSRLDQEAGLSAPRQIRNCSTVDEVLGVFAHVFRLLGVIPNKEHLSNDDVHKTLKCLRCPIHFTHITLPPQNSEFNGAEIALILEWLAGLVDLKLLPNLVPKAEELKMHVLFNQFIRSYECFLQGEDVACSMIHRSRLDDSRKLNDAHKHEMDEMKTENSTLLSFLCVGADLSQGISVKRSKEYELQMLEHAYRQKSKLHSEKVADSTSKLLHSRRRMSAMGRTLEDRIERVNTVQAKRNVGYMVDSKNTVESSICDLDRLVQLVSQLSNQYRKLISYLPSTCGPELLPEFTALTDCRGGVPEPESLSTIRRIRDLTTSKTRDIANLLLHRDVLNSNIVNAHMQRATVCSTLVAELYASESTYESERNQINSAISELKLELSQVELQFPKEELSNSLQEDISRKETHFAQTQGRCAQEKSTMQHDILLALDDMMSHKQKVLCSLDAK
mmetsp:Transcript_8855/g.29885  ORF Transcript_8855/g.29885 Transcript_8855/m.29885 type:complete len:462 (+) Transcript_8855:315-1700(+)